MDKAKPNVKHMADRFIGPGLELVEEKDRVYIDEYRQYYINDVMNASTVNAVDGYNFLPGFDGAPAKYAYDQLEFKNGDVVVSTYLKCGTTWVTAIVKQIIYGRQPQLLEKSVKMNQFYSYLEFGPVSKYRVTENIELPRKVYGTHLPEPLVNMDKLKRKGVKVVCVVRNPKDRVVSFYNFIKGFPYFEKEEFRSIFPKEEKDFYDSCFRAEAKSIVGIVDDYMDSLKSWWKHKNEENVMFVVYEELKKDPHAEIKKLSSFLGVTLNDEEINAIVEKTSFSKMKKDAETSGGEKESPIKMFRKGQVGEWKDHLTVAQSEHVDQKVKDMLADTGIKFIYE